MGGGVVSFLFWCFFGKKKREGPQHLLAEILLDGSLTKLEGVLESLLRWAFVGVRAGGGGTSPLPARNE